MFPFTGSIDRSNLNRHGFIWLIIFASATLSGVETLKYPPFHGICFFDEIFSFFSLVSDFFSKWNFTKNGF